MVKLLIGTRSAGKQREFRRLFAGAPFELLFPDDAGIAESAAEDALELHESFEGNARAKAEYFAKRSRLPTVADDSGLEVFSLGGEPGVRSRRWAQATGSTDAVDAANNAMLLRRLAGAPDNRRRARYRCVLVLARSASAIPEPFEGACGGLITPEPRGDHGFGYDPCFLSDDLGRTFGEAGDDEKDAVSHRGRAVRALLASLSTHPL
ncbi:MAG: non-canonical purine NTP pyrophosphatase [Gemmatimonadetes bacterium]|nr:non-canonical purine NTP pyrophosphatase [Gemmatimonadota bacterium]